MQEQSNRKTISDAKLKRATAFITAHIEPRIRTIIDTLNDHFKKDGIHCGVELKWFFDETKLKDN